MALDRRSRERGVSLESIQFESASASGTGRLVNAGTTGAFIGTDALPSEGQYVVLALGGAGSRPLEVEGRVRWSGDRLSDGVRGFGVEVSDPPQEYLDLVESLEIREPEGCGRRVAPRYAVSLPVAIEFGSLVDDGTLCDISQTGARLEGTAIRPYPGDAVTLTFALSLEHDPFEMLCHVVRPTPSGGYAVSFKGPEARLEDALLAVHRKTQPLPGPVGTG